MNRREFLKKSLEGILIGSIPLFYNCGKNPVKSETKNELPIYLHGILIVKFTEPSFLNKDFNIRIENNTVITGFKSVDSLNTYYKASRFTQKPSNDREFVFYFTDDTNINMKYIASEYSKDPNIEYAFPNWFFFIE